MKLAGNKCDVFGVNAKIKRDSVAANEGANFLTKMGKIA